MLIYYKSDNLRHLLTFRSRNFQSNHLSMFLLNSYVHLRCIAFISEYFSN